MLHSIYGPKQSVLKWYEQVCAMMSDLGFVRTKSDHVLFYYNSKDDITAGITTLAVNTTCTKVKCLIGWHIDNGMGL